VTQVDPDHQSACMHPTHCIQHMHASNTLVPGVDWSRESAPSHTRPDPVLFHGHWSRLARQRLGADSVCVCVCACVGEGEILNPHPLRDEPADCGELLHVLSICHVETLLLHVLPHHLQIKLCVCVCLSLSVSLSLSLSLSRVCASIRCQNGTACHHATFWCAKGDWQEGTEGELEGGQQERSGGERELRGERATIREGRARGKEE
jgi:hypothetical protein